MARKHSKRYRALLEQVGKGRYYTVGEALDLLKSLATTKFEETLDLNMRLGVDPRKAEENIRGTVVLPHGLGKTVKVAVFAKGEAAIQAEQAGADRVGDDDLIEDIQNGWSDFDVLVAHVDMMKDVGKLGRTLGPRMPNKKSGTATEDVGEAVTQLKAGKVEYRVDRQSNMSVPLGKIGFDKEKLLENFQTLMAAVLAARPASLKGVYVRQVYLATTMSPGLRIDVANARDVGTARSLAG
ncbi:MAG: 50S ribosomal protein L1 [Armatimonadota bacterium]|jgi:large subunit ribosomal protein L1